MLSSKKGDSEKREMKELLVPAATKQGHKRNIETHG